VAALLWGFIGVHLFLEIVILVVFLLKKKALSSYLPGGAGVVAQFRGFICIHLVILM
jgi:hypothetical protein